MYACRVRENTAHGLYLPETYYDRPRMEAAIVDKLHHGDPTLGWEGDPNLALYSEPDGSYMLCRLEADGEMRLVARSRPGLRLDDGLIRHLVAHDTRRVDPLDLVS